MGRRERRRRETRERIFRAAMNLFSERGFHETTIEDITEAADVAKGTFFNYFPGKEHVLGVFAEIQRGKVEAALATAHTGQVPIRDVVHRLMYSLVEYPSRSQMLMRSVLIALLSSSEIRQRLVTVLNNGRGLLAQIFTLGQQRGEVSPARRPEDLALHFQRLLFGSLSLWAMGIPDEFKVHLDSTFELFWAGAKSTALAIDSGEVGSPKTQ